MALTKAQVIDDMSRSKLVIGGIRDQDTTIQVEVFDDSGTLLETLILEADELISAIKYCIFTQRKEVNFGN